MASTILITGGSGFIGTRLTTALLDHGHSVVVADIVAPRIKHERLSFEKMDLSHDELPASYDGKIDGIVHLAGKNIFGRWTQSFKKEVRDSRIESTRKIVATISAWQTKPKTFVSASAFGYYGNAGETEVDESGAAGTDFLAGVCAEWEAESRKAETAGIRTVQIRTANVLGKSGLLAPLFVPFTFGLGAWIGTGKAWFPWVHVDDIVGIYVFALENENLSGPVNTAAPEQVRQKDFMKAFGASMHRWVLFSIPIFVLRMRYGALADTFDNGVRMSPQKVLATGYHYKYPKLADALTAVVQETK